MDRTDYQILNLLQRDCRATLKSVGDQVGLTAPAVSERVRRMEEKGIIEAYTVVINPQKINGAISCYFEIETQPETLQQVTDLLCANESVTQIYRVTGQNRLHVHAVTAGHEELERLLKEEMDRLPGVTMLSCHTILSRIKDVKGLRL